MKYVVVTGGVVSGLGKGVTASSVGVLLQASGLRVTAIKIDPYINTDAGTMSPFEHGEVFVLDDGGEVDLDLGNYERFLDVQLTKDNNITTGKIYQHVIERERRGDYLGKTVQVVPHITDAIQDWIERVAHVPVDGNPRVPDVCVIELGGTVGDIESIHVSLVPVLGVVGEQKTKPTQHSVQVLRSTGLVPHFLACRSQEPLDNTTKEKMSQFCHVPKDHIITMHDLSNIWHVPLLLKAQGAHKAILQQLNKPPVDIDLSSWDERANNWDKFENVCKIAMVGKYTGLSDSYISVLKSLQHACLATSHKLEVIWIEASQLEAKSEYENPEKFIESWSLLRSAHGVLVPGGFGDRGVEGKIAAAKYAREADVPYLGICLGMQVAVIEYARNVLGMSQAQSTEFNPATPQPVVVFMPEGSTTHMGGTMRLGSRRTLFQTVDCITSKLYQKDTHIDERHRHRYEVNPELIDKFEEQGMQFVGKDETGRRMEILELSGHPYFVATQFHPEYKSRPGKPSPVFLGLVLASTNQLDMFMQGKHAKKTQSPMPSPTKS
eukprot:CAMPEP_0114323128 /NCGR_PEP_ID=MMETSP0059-20121206/27679_1 /TAXON_ID=36894 /ORGANISM="Pyramimonas parkeae, Strain CCMP726" /LENGTH=549 /DNA_ID=CAMNT_0001451321 /DNA_START=156 /DNA_END=1805 /DNA_ORIENTATION=-